MDNSPSDNYDNNFKDLGGDDGDNDDSIDQKFGMEHSGGIFGDTFEIHSQLERLVDEMNKAIGIFIPGPSGIWENINGGMFSSYNGNTEPELQPKQEVKSLRDYYLKPSCTCNSSNEEDNKTLLTPSIKPETSNYTNLGNEFQSQIFSKSASLHTIKHSDFFPEQGTYHPNPKVQPQTYSTSVVIQTIRRPDGSVETIKKVRDHTGNEKTTITQTNVNEQYLPPPEKPATPKDDSSGLSIFKKFFSF